MSYLCWCLKACCKSVVIGLGRKEGGGMSFVVWPSPSRMVSKILLGCTIYLSFS
jgi:hypothetical protein